MLKRLFVVFVLLSMGLGISGAQAVSLSDQEIATLSETAMFGNGPDSQAALLKLIERGDKDVVSALILALRFRRDTKAIEQAITRLTGTPIVEWGDGMLWQEANPDVVPHASFRDLKLKLFNRIDPNFLRFLGGDRAKRENLTIRLEEITWGGVPVDGIPSLDSPTMITADAADYLLGDDLVFGIEINGDVRAYPLRIMGWHEMFNDTIGGVPVALAYCTLCGAAILFETQVEGREKPFVFGSSGFLYRSNKLMFDRETDSFWNQFTGQPVSGPLRTSGITLPIRAVVTTTWGDWKKQHPETAVLALETGFQRDYGSGVVYNDYFASPDLMFPTIVRDESIIKRKHRVFGICDVAAARAWPVTAFAGQSVINDAVGGRSVVLIGDAKNRSVRAYDRNDWIFQSSPATDQLQSDTGDWQITESALVGPNGQKLSRVPGHLSYWFAWDGYLGVNSTLYSPQ